MKFFSLKIKKTYLLPLISITLLIMSCSSQSDQLLKQEIIKSRITTDSLKVEIDKLEKEKNRVEYNLSIKKKRSINNSK